MKKKTIILVTLGLMLPQSAFGAQAGQYCKTTDSMKIVKSNKNLIQCVPTGANNRLRWKAVK